MLKLAAWDFFVIVYKIYTTPNTHKMHIALFLSVILKWFLEKLFSGPMLRFTHRSRGPSIIVSSGDWTSSASSLGPTMASRSAARWETVPAATEWHTPGMSDDAVQPQTTQRLTGSGFAFREFSPKLGRSNASTRMGNALCVHLHAICKLIQIAFWRMVSGRVRNSQGSLFKSAMQNIWMYNIILQFFFWLVNSKNIIRVFQTLKPVSRSIRLCVLATLTFELSSKKVVSTNVHQLSIRIKWQCTVDFVLPELGPSGTAEIHPREVIKIMRSLQMIDCRHMGEHCATRRPEFRGELSAKQNCVQSNIWIYLHRRVAWDAEMWTRAEVTRRLANVTTTKSATAALQAQRSDVTAGAIPTVPLLTWPARTYCRPTHISCRKPLTR